MLEFIKRAKILFLASILAIAAFTYFVIYRLIETRLEYSVLENFMDLSFANNQAIEYVVDGYIQNAQWLSGITTIKNVAANYKKGFIDSQELRKHTQTTYGDSAKGLKNLVFTQRVVDGQVIAHYGEGETGWQTEPILTAEGDTLDVSMMNIGEKIYAVVYSPISTADEVLGADNLVFDISPAVKQLSRNNYKVDILDNARFISLKGNGEVAITGSQTMLYDCGSYYLFSRRIFNSSYLCITSQKDYILKGTRGISLTILYLTGLLFTVLLAAFYFFLIRYANVVMHVTEKSREDYQDIAFRDTLTGAYTRAFLSFWTKNIFQFDRKYCVAVIDIDDMKYINDTYGHAMGDDALKSFSSFIRSFVRSGDIVARLGGDEFLVILENADEETGRKVMEHIQAESDAGFTFDFKIGFSYGISIANKNSGLKEAIKAADSEMYKQKDQKKHIREDGDMDAPVN